VLAYDDVLIGDPVIVEPGGFQRGDVDANGKLEITDPILNLTFQFIGGVAPAPPGKETCGVDPTIDELGCDSFPPCD